MPKQKVKINEKMLTRGELRKLAALRRSVGEDLADEVFAKWYAKERRWVSLEDPNISNIEQALHPYMKKIRIPKGGAYAIRRGRGRFIIEPIELNGGNG